MNARDKRVDAAAIAAALGHLRGAFRESADAYAARIEGDLSSILKAVRLATGPEGRRTRGGEVSGRARRDLRDMQVLLADLCLKPAKGRRKDLRRVEELVADLLSRTSEW